MNNGILALSTGRGRVAAHVIQQIALRDQEGRGSGFRAPGGSHAGSRAAESNRQADRRVAAGGASGQSQSARAAAERRRAARGLAADQRNDARPESVGGADGGTGDSARGVAGSALAQLP